MPTKAILLWRLCDWYIKKNPPFSPDVMFEVYRAMTKTIPIPNQDFVTRDKDSDPYCYEPLPLDEEQIATMYRYLVAKTNLISMAHDCRLDFVWQGHKVEYPKFFDDDEIKEDQTIIKWLAKRAIKAIKHGSKSG